MQFLQLPFFPTHIATHTNTHTITNSSDVWQKAVYNETSQTTPPTHYWNNPVSFASTASASTSPPPTPPLSCPARSPWHSSSEIWRHASLSNQQQNSLNSFNYNTTNIHDPQRTNPTDFNDFSSMPRWNHAPLMWTVITVRLGGRICSTFLFMQMLACYHTNKPQWFGAISITLLLLL